MCGRKYDAEEAQYERAVQDLNIDGPGRPRSRKKSRKKLLDLPPPSFDIRPTNKHVVIVRQGEGTTPEVMTWGYHPAWAKRILVNSRAEKLEGRVWGKAFRERRCIVPVAGFYEWSGPKKAGQPHAISLTGEPVMLLAGLWIEHEGETSYTIITAEAGKWMSQIHNREPVIVRAADVEEYLLSDDPPFDLVREAEDGELTEFACAKPEKSTPPQPVG